MSKLAYSLLTRKVYLVKGNGQREDWTNHFMQFCDEVLPISVEYESHLSGKPLTWYLDTLARQGFEAHYYRHNGFGHDLAGAGTVYAERVAH